MTLSAGAPSAVSAAPAKDDDEDAHHAADTGSGTLARTGAAERALVLAGGLLLLVGGWSVLAGAPRRRPAR